MLPVFPRCSKHFGRHERVQHPCKQDGISKDFLPPRVQSNLYIILKDGIRNMIGRWGFFYMVQIAGCSIVSPRNLFRRELKSREASTLLFKEQVGRENQQSPFEFSE